MRAPIYNVALARAAQRLPLIKRVPLARIVIATELAMLAKRHYELLTPTERRRLVVLLRHAKCQTRNMSPRERSEFERIVTKLEPKMFAQAAVKTFSPVGSSRKGISE